MTPTMPTTIVSLRVPDGLIEHDQWVLWRYEARQGKRAKVPYQTNGKPADSTNPSTWSSFEEAVSAWDRTRQRYAGVGFVFSKEDGLAGSTTRW